MSAVQVKICGLTRLEDARAAVLAGAGWLGFNFYPPSPRYLEPSACRQIVEALRSELPDALRAVRLVGVFVHTSPADILATLDGCALDLAQLSGEETSEHLAVLGDRAYPVLHLGGPYRPEERLGAAPLGRTPPAALIDAAVPGLYGGSGELANWRYAQAVAAEWPVFLAGGLNPENVVAAVRSVHPWGVDVASGVERSPGVKDPRKMKAFIHAARQAGDEIEEIQDAQDHR